MELIETINLPNGLTLTISDASRRIAKDTIKVELFFQVKIEVQDSFFESPEDCHQLRKVFGDELTYEHKMERSFVNDNEEESIRTELLNTFKNNSLGYLSSPNFAKKMALSLLRDIKLNPFSIKLPLIRNEQNNRDDTTLKRKVNNDPRHSRCAAGRR